MSTDEQQVGQSQLQRLEPRWAYDALVDWRTRVRQAINREDALSWWRLAVLRLVDPIEWYMRKDEQRSRAAANRHARRATRRLHPPSASYSLLSQDDDPGGIPITNIAVARVFSEDHHQRDRAKLRVTFAPYLDAWAAELLAGHRVEVRTTGGIVRARLRRFRTGGVLERETVSPRSRGHGKRRLDLSELRPPNLQDHLLDLVMQLGSEVRPT